MSPVTAIVGASGYVGGRFTEYLTGRGTEVLALGRDAARLPSGTGVHTAELDVGDGEAVARTLEGIEVVYYLAHAMAVGTDFAERDRGLARSFAEGAAKAGVRRIVYLGALGAGDLSEHLASRQEVGAILERSGVPTVELRAAVILGTGSISFEMLRYLTERLPAMICPRWVQSTLQPLAEADLLAYLREAATVEPGIYQVGGPDRVSYLDMMQAYARVRGLPRRRILPVPLLTPRLSSHWVDLVTPVDSQVSHSLIESLTNDVVVTDQERTDLAFSVRPMGLEDGIRAALDIQAERVAKRVAEFEDGLVDGVFSLRSHVPLRRQGRAAAELDLRECGGDLHWYAVPWAWRVRITLGKLFGERLSLHRPEVVEPGARVDWWTVREKTTQSLVLETEEWFCGEAWLSYRTREEPERELQQVGALRPKGLLGWAYWRAVWPIHIVVFHWMAKKQADRAEALGAQQHPASTG